MKDTLDQAKDNEAMTKPEATSGEDHEDGHDQMPDDDQSQEGMNFFGKKVGFGYIALALLIIVVVFFGAKNKILEYFSEPYNPETPAISKPEDAPEAMQPAEPAADDQKDAASAVPQDAAAMPQPQRSVMTEDGVKVIVKDFILNNPEVIMESLSRLQKKADEQQAQASKEFLNKSSSTRPFIGNKDSTMNIVEFFDYQCIHCKNVYPDLMKLITAYPNLKITLVQLPFMGPASAKAVKFSLAVNNLYPDKFYSFHSDLIQSDSISEEGIMGLIDKYGLDKSSLTTEANSDKIDKMIKDNLDLAQKSGVKGVPSFAINGETTPGAPSYDELKAKVDAMVTSK